VDLDVEAERGKQTVGEELYPLPLLQQTRAGQERLKAILILRDGSGAATVRQLEEGRCSERRAISQIDQLLEAAPRWRTLVRLDLDVPHLRPVLQVVGGHPDLLLLLHDAQLVEVGLPTINEDEGISLAVVPWKVHLLELGWAVVVVLAEARLGAEGRRAVSGETGDGLGVSLGHLGVGLNSLLQVLQGFHDGLEVAGFGHVRCR